MVVSLGCGESGHLNLSGTLPDLKRRSFYIYNHVYRHLHIYGDDSIKVV